MQTEKERDELLQHAANRIKQAAAPAKPKVVSKVEAKAKNPVEPVKPAEPEKVHHNPHLDSPETQATRRGLN